MDLNHNILSTSTKPWAVQAAGQPFVYFNYNLVGDNTKVYSSVADDWERNYTYDRLGRRLTYTEGELAEYLTYDGSNLATHTQSWTENNQMQTKTTTYHYNAHRLDSVCYDDALTTIYHYDQYGRVDSLYDESGVMCYTYGNMGEVTQETRIYALPFLTNPLALSTQFTYDSWGRILNITYPDNEVVSYAYDLGGQLGSITNNSSYTYLDNVSYDRFGAKVSQTYGNGITTDYSYNNVTRRLSAISTTNNGTPMSQIQYAYDPVGNVTQVTSSCPWLNSQSLTETFTYDASDQLTAAQSVVSGQPSVSNYQLAVTYGNWGKISSYGLTQRDMQHNSTQSETQAYTYPSYNSIGNSQTLFAPQQRTITDISNNVATETLTFGINGSLRRRDVQAQNSFTEYYLFNSASNLKAYSNNGLDFAYYGYNATNTRTYKLNFLNQNQWVNGQPEPLSLQLQSAMFYPNAYINFNQNGEYTKHYYNGTERIASRLGSSTQPTDATSNDRLEYRMMREEEKFRENIQELVSDGQPVDFQGTVELNSLQPVNATSDIFYYHTNHLGSTAFVTDNNATITQGFLYAPFGEITTEYNANFGNNVLPKYAFNAKELDEETGMYYYEARYYKPPVFTSRDPMFEKYFWMTPYAYCANNPVKYVDPTGMEIGDPLKIMKVRRMSVSNTFGNVRHNSDGSPRVHQGIDYYAEEGTPIYAVKSGKIVALGKQGDYGMTITLEFAQEDGTMAYAFYAHLSSYNVEIGQNVEEGDEIGKTGNTGNASNLKGDDQHLHFEYRLQKNLGRGLTGRDDPNKIVDTKFVVDPENPSKVIRYIDLLLRNAAPCIPAISSTEQWIDNIRTPLKIDKNLIIE